MLASVEVLIYTLSVTTTLSVKMMLIGRFELLCVSKCVQVPAQWKDHFGDSSSLLYLIVIYEMLISNNRNVLNCMILPLLSMMTLCSVEYWLWTLPSIQTRMTRREQRSSSAVGLQNKAWMISEPGDNVKNRVYSWLLQIWVWMGLLEVGREVFTLQKKQFSKIQNDVTASRWYSFLNKKEMAGGCYWSVYILVCKVFSSNVLGGFLPSGEGFHLCIKFP